MHVEIGPLPSSSALAWIGYARGVVDDLRAAGGRVPGSGQVLPDDVLDAFAGYLDEWQRAASGSSFRWAGDADAEVVEYLLHAWFNLARALAARAEESGGSIGPPEGQHFYNALVVALLDALAEEGHEPARAFAEELREFWPGLDDGSS